MPHPSEVGRGGRRPSVLSTATSPSLLLQPRSTNIAEAYVHETRAAQLVSWSMASEAKGSL